MAVTTELIRSDMEFRSERGQNFEARGYFHRYPRIHADSDSKKAIVFEEYRLRVAQGAVIDPEEFASQFGIDSFGCRKFQAALAALRATLLKNLTFDFPVVGDSFEGFELVGQLGEGAFGRVFWRSKVRWKVDWWY